MLKHRREISRLNGACLLECSSLPGLKSSGTPSSTHLSSKVFHGIFKSSSGLPLSRGNLQVGAGEDYLFCY